MDREPASLLYLINLTAGLMDGDAHLIEITAREGVRAVVTGQSATRIHPALQSHATQQWVVQVENDACLVVLPGPAIPFRGCRYYQRGRVELAPRARLIWGDIWLPGRYERGELSERFQFERIVQDFEVRQAGRLIYRDRFRWDGPWTPEEAHWYFGEKLAVASLFLAGPIPDDHVLPEPRSGACAIAFRPRRRRRLHAMVRRAGGRNGRPRAHRPAAGGSLDDRTRRPALAPRLGRPGPQPLVLNRNPIIRRVYGTQAMKALVLPDPDEECTRAVNSARPHCFVKPRGTTWLCEVPWPCIGMALSFGRSGD